MVGCAATASDLYISACERDGGAGLGFNVDVPDARAKSFRERGPFLTKHALFEREMITSRATTTTENILDKWLTIP